MFTTSFTTAIAFGATAVSTIPTISAFGITMGFMVAINYALAITFFPACVVWSERYAGETRGLVGRSANGILVFNRETFASSYVSLTPSPQQNRYLNCNGGCGSSWELGGERERGGNRKGNVAVSPVNLVSCGFIGASESEEKKRSEFCCLSR